MATVTNTELIKAVKRANKVNLYVAMIDQYTAIQKGDFIAKIKGSFATKWDIHFEFETVQKQGIWCQNQILFISSIEA